MRKLKKWMAVKGENGNFIVEWEKMKFKKDDKPDSKGHVRIKIELVGEKHAPITGNKVGTFHIWDATVGEIFNITEKSLELGADLKQSHVIEYEGGNGQSGVRADPVINARNEEMREFRRKGFTFSQLAEKYDISRQLCHKICSGVEIEHRKKTVKEPRKRVVKSRLLKEFRSNSCVTSEGEHFFLKGENVDATGELYEHGFVVREGSMARKKIAPSALEIVSPVQTKLIESGVLVEENGRYRFTQDYMFGTPSGASSIVLGRTSNGWAEWKTADGKTLNDVERAVYKEKSKRGKDGRFVTKSVA